MKKNVFDMQSGTNVAQDFLLSWKKPFSGGFILLTRKKNENCVNSVYNNCDMCRAKTKRSKEMKDSSNELKKTTKKTRTNVALFSD